jgi:hypothetical protein
MRGIAATVTPLFARASLRGILVLTGLDPRARRVRITVGYRHREYSENIFIAPKTTKKVVLLCYCSYIYVRPTVVLMLGLLLAYVVVICRSNGHGPWSNGLCLSNGLSLKSSSTLPTSRQR